MIEIRLTNGDWVLPSNVLVLRGYMERKVNACSASPKSREYLYKHIRDYTGHDYDGRNDWTSVTAEEVINNILQRCHCR